MTKPAVRRPLAMSHLLALVLLALLVAGAVWMSWWGWLLLRALFLPGNLQRLLHLLEVGLLALLAADLALLTWGRHSRARAGVRLPDGSCLALGSRTIVGSAPGLRGLRLRSAEVSRRHCELRLRRDGGLTIADLGSTNGTFAAGRALRRFDAQPLRAGDRVELGRGGPALEVLELPPKAILSEEVWLLGFAALLGLGLLLGALANREILPAAPLVVGSVSVSFAALRSSVAIALLGGATWAVVAAWAWAAGRAGSNEPAPRRALSLLIALGIVLLLPLLPAVAFRYGEAALRAQNAVGADSWNALEAWEQRGGSLEALRCGDPRWQPGSAVLEPPLPGLSGRDGALRRTLCRFREGREALRWAVNLGGAADAPLLASTYFRQSGAILGIALLGLVPVLLWPGARARIVRGVEGLGSPLTAALVRQADRGVVWARILRPFAYRDLALGALAAGLVALTLVAGSSRGRGKTLFLDLPGLPSLQTIELVKALFILFLAGYFARQGELLAVVPRRRYLVPYLAAVLATLGLTAAQADMGGLLMLGLFLALLFLGATGSFRLLLSVPALLVPGLALAFWAGKASILQTRLELWVAPREHPVGEQLVQARQLLLSSGWTGYLPAEARAARIPDIQGDLALAAFVERFGAVGALALLVAVAVLGAWLLRAARASRGPRRLVLAGLSALLLVQFATQAGGLFGLLPLTGVPLPWLSQGLTASLVFTLLAALALAVAPHDASERTPERRRDPLVFLARSQGAALAALAGLALFWSVALPALGDVGPLGADYRWSDPDRVAAVERALADGRFAPRPGSEKVELVADRPRKGPASHPDDLAAMAEGLRVVDGRIRPLPWLVSNPNLFADRSRRSGWIVDRRGEVLALSDRRGTRLFPQGAAAFHPVGQTSGVTLGRGVDEAAHPLLVGRELPAGIRLRAFVEDVQRGPDLRLTLDAGLQREAFEALAGRRGAVVAMELPTGALLVSASSPSIDPATVGRDGWRELLREPEGLALLDRALRSSERYSPPGSAFKPVLAAAILTSPRGFDPNRTELCTGYDSELRVACAHGHAHGRVDLARALEVSCNIYFARAAVRLGEEEIRRAAARFGLGEGERPNLLRGAADLDLRSTPAIVLPTGGRPLPARDLARVGYGQGPVSVTPLDLARMGAVIATGGERVEPFLAAALELSGEEDGARRVRWSSALDARERERVLPVLAAEQLDLVLRGVFDAPGGTGRNLPKLWTDGAAWRLSREAPGDGWSRVPVAGKTGSAWRSTRDTTDDAWMVAWAPAGAPRVVVSVLLEDAGEGGKVAGPVALGILRSALERLGEEEGGDASSAL